MPSALSSKTRDRILDGATEAIARHGLAKLSMGDVSESASLSRGTVYRYFSNRDELLTVLAHREGARFQETMRQALVETPEGAEQIQVALQYAARHAREHPLLRRIVETDPAFVLRAIRERLPAIKEMMRDSLGVLLGETELVGKGVATSDQLLDWMTRLMISAFLFPDPDPDRMARDLTAVYRVLTLESGDGIEPGKRRAGDKREKEKS